MFASACKIYDSFNDRELRRIKQTVRESSSWSRQMKSGRHLSRVVSSGSEPARSSLPARPRPSRPVSILEREASLQPVCFEASQQLADSWRNRFAGCGAELSSDQLRRSLQESSQRQPRVQRELEKAMGSVAQGQPIVSDAILANLPLTEAEIKRQSQEKYQKVGKAELRDFLVDCHVKALREKNHIKIHWKLEEVYKIKEDTFLQKLQVQSNRYYRPPKHPFVADPRKPKAYKGLKLVWRAKPSLLQTFRSLDTRKMIRMDSEQSRGRESQPGPAQQSHRSGASTRAALQPADRSGPGAELPGRKSEPMGEAEKQASRLNKTVSTSLHPATLTVSVPQAGSVREFSLNHLLDGQQPRKSFMFEQSGGALLLLPKEPLNRSRMASSRKRSTRSISELHGDPPKFGN